MTHGINRLIAVTQLKAHNANDDAMHGADKQRELVGEQRDLRARQQKLEEFVRDKNLDDGEYWAIARMLRDSGLDTGGVDGTYDGILGHYDAGHQGQAGHWNAQIGGDAGSQLATDNDKKMEEIRKRMEGAMKDLEAQDRLGNFEIQDLMSQYNQAETLASSALKKRDDTAGALINKVG